MITAIGLLALAAGLSTAALTLTNSDFEGGLKGWKTEGDVKVEAASPLAGRASVRMGPGRGAVRQRYDVPGLRILWLGATLKPSGSEVEAKIRIECFDKRGRSLMTTATGLDPKRGASIYLKTHAFTHHIVVSIEKDEAGTLLADDALLKDDDKGRIEHHPEVDLNTAMRPFWKGDTITDETVLLFSEKGAEAAGELLFTPKRILSVRDPERGVQFVEGTDFKVDGRTLTRLAGAALPMASDAEIPKGDFPWLDLTGRHIVVTYTHDDSWTGRVPSYVGDRLPLTMAKLKGKKPLTVVALGDSITLGTGGSGFRNVPPYLPPWPSLFAERLGRSFRSHRIRLYNVALGGMTASWGEENARTTVATLDPDLVILAFGMNDFWSVTPPEFVASVRRMMATIRERRPKAEFLLVSSIGFDPAYTVDPTYVGNLAGYAQELQGLSGTGVHLLDMTSLSAELYRRKGAKGLLSDPMHPADFLARIYAQGLVAAFEREGGQ